MGLGTTRLNYDEQIHGPTERIGVKVSGSWKNIRDRNDDRQAGKRKLLGFEQMLAATDKPVLSVGVRTEGSEPTDNMMMITEPEDAASMMAKMVEYGQYLKRVGAG
jgi:hypothetical protein